MRWTTRQIEAPSSDTLSAAEVAVYLGYRDGKSVMRLVEEGKFPEPIEEDGRRWLWEDVVWFLMTKRIRPRLRKPPGVEFPTPPPDAGAPKRRTMSDKPGKGRDSVGSAPEEP